MSWSASVSLYSPSPIKKIKKPDLANQKLATNLVRPSRENNQEESNRIFSEPVGREREKNEIENTENLKSYSINKIF